MSKAFATPRLGQRLLAASLIWACGAISAKTFVYVANYNNSTIAAFIERHDGLLIPNGSSATPTGPESIAIDKEGFVVTADSLAHAISVYRIKKASGRLVRTAVQVERPTANPFSLTTSPLGHFLYVANSGDSTVAIYRLHAHTGAVTKDGQIREAHGASPYAVALTPHGRHVYVANFGNDTIGMYERIAGHGHVRRLGVFHEPLGDGPYGMSVGPSGRFLYVADFRANVLLVLAIGPQGQLSVRDRVAEPFDHHPDSLVIDPSGRYLFVANTSANDISIFHINQTTGGLAHVGRVATGGYPFSLTLDAAARFVYAVNFGNSTISRYRLNRDTGRLVTIGTTKEVSYADPYGIAAVTFPGRGRGKAPVRKKAR